MGCSEGLLEYSVTNTQFDLSKYYHTVYIWWSEYDVIGGVQYVWCVCCSNNNSLANDAFHTNWECFEPFWEPATPLLLICEPTFIRNGNGVMAHLIKFEANCTGLTWAFVHLSPVAYPKLNYALEFGLRFSQFVKSSQYLIKVAQEMIRKRREAQNDTAYVKVWFIHYLHYINISVNGHYSILFICHLWIWTIYAVVCLSNNRSWCFLFVC